QPHPQGAKWLRSDYCPTALISERRAMPEIDFFLVKTGVVNGQVVGAHGRPVSHAQVMMEYPDGSAFSILTNCAGRFRFRSAPAEIRMSWSPDGEQPMRQTRT